MATSDTTPRVSTPFFTVSWFQPVALLLGDCSALCSRPKSQKFWHTSGSRIEIKIPDPAGNAGILQTTPRRQILLKLLISLSKFNLPRIGTFTWLTPPGPYRATICRERECLWITYIDFFWPHKDMEGLPRWGISSNPRPPPRQHVHERRYTPVTHPFILIRRVWKEIMMAKWYGDLRGLKLPDICFTGEENPRKNLIQETCPDRGPAAWLARALPPVPQRWARI